MKSSDTYSSVLKYVSNVKFSIGLGLLFFLLAFFPVRFSDITLPVVTVSAIIFLSLPATLSLLQEFSIRRTILGVGLISAFALSIETIGLYTHFPYSAFTYSDALGPKLFMLTPLVVFFAFTPLVLGGLRIASVAIQKTNITQLRSQYIYKLVFLAALIIVGIDLLLDPVVVYLGYWIWASPGFYYGIPFVNFLGWLFSAILAILIYVRVFGLKTAKFQEVSFVYSVWFWAGAAFFAQLWIPFILGLVFLGWYYSKYAQFYDNL